MALFESYERRIDKINGVLAQYGIGSVEECREICKAKGFDPYEIVKGIQPICFENACWAYTVGAAIALKSGVKTAAEAAKMIGVGLQSFCIDGSVAEDRKVGLGHGNLGAMLLSDESKCFAFLAGHESFAAAEGAIGIVKNANKARKEPLRVILNGLGKDAAQIISRINGFTYVQTQFDYYTGKLSIVREIRYSEGERADVRCYGADDVREGVAIMHHEGVDVSITGNSTNPTRFQHPVAGTYKKECIEQGKKYFSVASGGGTGRTLHPDNMGAGPASYGMTDTMGRMHSDAQFAGSELRIRWFGRRSRLHLPLSAGAAAPETGQRLSGYYPVHQYRRCLCAGPNRGAGGEVCQAEPADASVPSGGGVRRLHHLLYLFRGDGRSAAKRKDRPCDAVYGAEPAVGRDGGAAGAAVGAVKRQRRDI